MKLNQKILELSRSLFFNVSDMILVRVSWLADVLWSARADSFFSCCF